MAPPVVGVQASACLPQPEGCTPADILNRPRARQCCLAGLALALAVFVFPLPVARADRSAAQGPSGWYLEKRGRYAEAALYYQRALRGFQEVWVKFSHHGRSNEAHGETQQLIGEYRDRLERCLQKAKLGEAKLEHMAMVNELWMAEYVNQELGGYKLAFAYRAEEAEKHGDFLLAEQLRLAAADYCRIVAIPYHQRLASQLDKQGRPEAAVLHREAATQYEQQALEHQLMARGDKVLAGIPGLQGPASHPDLGRHYFNSYRVYHRRVLSVKGSQWITGTTSQQVAAILKQTGLNHADTNARFASVVVLANLGENKAMLTALADQSPRVRLAAAQALAATHWADGWAACGQHADDKVRQVIDPLAKPAGEPVLSRTASITELVRGLESESAGTPTFCQTALQRITGKIEPSAGAWRTWWNGLGNAKSGLVRTGPSGSAVVDETIDLGMWWQSGERSIHNRLNPLSKYSFPAKIRWRGSLVVTRAGNYRFYVRSRGAKKSTFDRHEMLYFTDPCAKLWIDGSPALTNPSDVVEDAKMHMRIDWSKPLRLKPGLHKILLELDVISAGTGLWQSPSVRLYWRSEHFLRAVVPADHLVHVQDGN